MRTIWARSIVGVTLLAALPAAGETVGAGQTRRVEGKISAVDIAHRTVVMDVPTPKGPFTVGVTLAESVSPKMGGKSLSLSDVAIGSAAILKYTREDDKLIGLDLQVKR